MAGFSRDGHILELSNRGQNAQCQAKIFLRIINVHAVFCEPDLFSNIFGREK